MPTNEEKEERMTTKIDEVQMVLKALHLAAVDTTIHSLDHDGDRTVALWVAALAVSEPGAHESLDRNWPALVNVSREYVGFAEAIRAEHRKIKSPDQIGLMTQEEA
jgi:hypothetical protein